MCDPGKVFSRLVTIFQGFGDLNLRSTLLSISSTHIKLHSFSDRVEVAHFFFFFKGNLAKNAFPFFTPPSNRYCSLDWVTVVRFWKEAEQQKQSR